MAVFSEEGLTITSIDALSASVTMSRALDQQAI